MNIQSSNDRPESIPCNYCPAGIMRLRDVTYFTWLGEELVTAPNFPAWVCDMCGKREYDEQAVSVLAMILNPQAGKPTRRIKPTPQPDTFNRNIQHPRSTNR
ncbi:MAG TPA: YgiT-type zinc finger protein [Anaerolineales bacterium]|nr:YgiT-type zinc finger protein [Anaerolineales bacterium]